MLKQLKLKPELYSTDISENQDEPNSLGSTLVNKIDN